MAKRCSANAGDFLVVQFALEDVLWPIAILLLDGNDKLHVRARTNLGSGLLPDDVEVVQGCLDDLSADAQVTSGSHILAGIEDRWSNALRITVRNRISVMDPEVVLDALSKQFLSVE